MRTRYLEKDFQADFNKYLKHIFYKTGAFELKVTEETSLPFGAVKDHQMTALYHAKHGNFVYKIPDDAVSEKPFDAFMLVMVPSYVVVMFRSKERGQREFVMIDIDAWISEKKISERKSLTEERAKEIGRVCFLA